MFGHLQTILDLDELRTGRGILVAGHTLVKEDISKLAADADKDAHDTEEHDKTVSSLRENANEPTTSKEKLQESLRNLMDEHEVTKAEINNDLQELKEKFPGAHGGARGYEDRVQGQAPGAQGRAGFQRRRDQSEP